MRQWSLTTLKEKLVKIGAKVTRNAKYVTFQLAEVAVPRHIFAAILKRIGRLGQSPALCRSGWQRSLGMGKDGTGVCEGETLHRWRRKAGIPCSQRAKRPAQAHAAPVC